MRHHGVKVGQWAQRGTVPSFSWALPQALQNPGLPRAAFAGTQLAESCVLDYGGKGGGRCTPPTIPCAHFQHSWALHAARIPRKSFGNLAQGKGNITPFPTGVNFPLPKSTQRKQLCLKPGCNLLVQERYCLSPAKPQEGAQQVTVVSLPGEWCECSRAPHHCPSAQGLCSLPPPQVQLHSTVVQCSNFAF